MCERACVRACVLARVCARVCVCVGGIGGLVCERVRVCVCIRVLIEPFKFKPYLGIPERGQN